MSDFDKYREYVPQKKIITSLIDRADAEIDITDVYNAMGFNAPRGAYGSFKIDCPFNYEHPDGGKDKNCRIYAPHHIYCFWGHGIMTSTYLYSRWKDVPIKRAAIMLLEERGLLRNKNYKEQWNELVELRDKDVSNSLGSTTDVIKSLQTAIQQNVNYYRVEYSDRIRKDWSSITTSLEILWQRQDTNLEKINAWFERAFTRLQNSVKEELNEN